MISFISKANNLKALGEPLLKAEVLSFPVCTGFQRTLFTNNILYSRIINKNKIKVNGSNFGKILELSENFDDFKLSEDNEKRKRCKEKSHTQSVTDDHYVKNKSRKEIFHQYCGLFSSIMTQLKSRKHREKNQEIILEGKRIIKHAISAGYIPHKIFCSNSVDLEELKLPEGIKVFNLPYKSFEIWSDLTTSQGIIGIFKMPKLSATKKPHSLPLTIVCDNVRDPGNLGSIIRVISSVGCSKLILTKGCVHIWEPKVIRSAAGAHFQLPETKYNLQWSDIKNEISENSRILLADLCNEASEDENAPDLATFRSRNEISEKLPADCYYSLKYKDEDTVIIIGGETHGISNEAYEFALERKGSKIFIPMNNHVESLNNAVALGILVYEFRRQYDLIFREVENEEKLSVSNCNP